MLNKIKDLVFGLNEFEKTKIDFRFEKFFFLVDDLDIKRIEDFEILEEVIFKIRELLRIRSSNLNKVILNPAKKLKKKDVLFILEKLDNLKYDFLKKAFNLIENKNKDLNYDFKDKNNLKEDFLKNENFKQKEELKKEVVLNKGDNFKEKKDGFCFENLVILEDENKKIFLENGKVAYILIDFFKKIDFVLLKDLAVILFDVYKALGTNILVEGLKVLIIPRFENDKLFDMPRESQEVNFDEILEKILKNVSKFSDKKDDLKNLDEIKEGKEDFLDVRDFDKNDFAKKKSLKKDDLSLDSLLDKDLNKDLNNKSNKNLSFKEKEIKEKEIKEDEIKKVDNQNSNKEKEEKKNLEVKANNCKEDEISSENLDKKEVLDENLKDEKKDLKKIDLQEFEIYRDDKIVAYFSKKGANLGELHICDLFGRKLNKIEQSNLTYMMIFSKIFSSVLFETLNAHGTNLIFNFDSNFLKIIPRFQDDNIDLLWPVKNESESFLEDLRSKLLKVMSGENVGQIDKVKEDKKIEETSEEKLKKAKHILDSLKRLP